jgi:hypothetical protein
VMAVAALATALVGHQVSGVAQVAVLDVVLLAALLPALRESASAHAPGDG